MQFLMNLLQKHKAWFTHGALNATMRSEDQANLNCLIPWGLIYPRLSRRHSEPLLSLAHTLNPTLSPCLIKCFLSFLLLAVLVLLILSMRRHRKQPYIIDDDENIHENIVRYDDEGGGEEDTEAFDIAAMWNPREAQAGATKTRQDMIPEIESLSRYVPQTCAVSSTVHSYVLAKLYEADMDLWAPPFDSLQTYMFEGEGSVAGSLSSLQSATSDSEQSFDFLMEWGPRFRKLAELYGTSEGPAPLW